MADELSIDLTVNYNKTGYPPLNIPKQNKLVTISGTPTNRILQTISTAPTPLNLGDITSLGYIYFQNTDTTINIDLQVGTGGTPFSTLYPGQIAIFPAATTNLYAVAASGSPKLDIGAWSR